MKNINYVSIDDQIIDDQIQRSVNISPIIRSLLELYKQLINYWKKHKRKEKYAKSYCFKYIFCCLIES